MPVKSASACANRLASELFHINRDSKISVTASLGVASLEGPHDTFEQLMVRADGARYAAKQGGRNRVVADAA